jgi:hypothetical protein
VIPPFKKCTELVVETPDAPPVGLTLATEGDARFAPVPVVKFIDTGDAIETLVLFVPFSKIEFIVSSVSSILLSEAAFGLGE